MGKSLRRAAVVGCLAFFLGDVACSDPPRFSLSDPELEELIQDFLTRHLRMDLSAASLRRRGGASAQEALTLWNDWEVTQYHWFDSSRRTFPLEDRRAEFVRRVSTIPIDRFGYVWSAPLGYEEATGEAGESYGQGWRFPAYGAAGGRGIGVEWNGDSLEGWEVKQGRGVEVKDGWLHFTSSGPFPELYSPILDVAADHAPFVELDFVLDEVFPPDPYIRWMRMEWTPDEDPRWSDRRRVELKDFGTLPPMGLRPGTRYRLYFPMYLHPDWRGKVHQVRIAPFTYWGRAFGRFRYNYVRFGYDTRHTVNNPVYILAVWRYFLWSGDKWLLQRNLPNLRRATLFLNHHLRGRELGVLEQAPFFRGHDAAGATSDGMPNPGHGIASGHFDLLGLGSRDFLCNLLYIQALEAMARVEELFPPATGAQQVSVAGRDGKSQVIYEETQESLSRLASEVRSRVRDLFWNPATGRFAGGIDAAGEKVDYGFVYLNLMALSLGIPTAEQADLILDWIDGKRVVEGDTSTGSDIYFWRFAPRTSTRRNERHYVWTHVAALREGDVAFGEQVQDGGAALWGSYYDVLARLRCGRTESAWQRFREILAWHRDVREKGGTGDQFYRAAYPAGDIFGHDPPIQTPWDGFLHGGGTPGGLALDSESAEGALVPASILFGFLGADISEPEVFELHPRIPKDLEFMGVSGILYVQDRLQIKAGRGWVDLAGSIVRSPKWELRVRFERGGEGEPKVLRDGSPYEAYEVLGDGTVLVTDRDRAAHRYDVLWQRDSGAATDEGG